jgi:hypothetical protein
MTALEDPVVLCDVSQLGVTLEEELSEAALEPSTEVLTFRKQVVVHGSRLVKTGQSLTFLGVSQYRQKLVIDSEEVVRRRGCASLWVTPAKSKTLTLHATADASGPSTLRQRTATYRKALAKLNA